MSLDNLLLLIFACLAVNLSPGPSVLLVTGAIVNGSIAYLVAVGSRRASGKLGQLVQRWIPGSVSIFLGLRLLWQDN